jgi:uncharacterized protein (TIGR00255 family)
MSVQSMTGYGRFEQVFESGKYSVEIKSVNNRFSEIQCRLPKVFSPLEIQIRKFLNEKLERGSINLNLNFEAVSGAVSIDYDENLVERYLEVFDKISNKFNREKLKDISLLSPFFRDFIVTKPVEYLLDELNDDLMHVIGKAVEFLVAEREREGTALNEFLLKSLDSILQNVEKIECHAPCRTEKYKAKMQTAIDSLLKEHVDEQRIALELVLMVEKLDITEETTRLKTHVSATKNLLETGTSVGKRLGFWLQEISREINTIGSKANDSIMADIVVAMKDTAEQMREQSLNLV